MHLATMITDKVDNGENNGRLSPLWKWFPDKSVLLLPKGSHRDGFPPKIAANWQAQQGVSVASGLRAQSRGRI